MTERAGLSIALMLVMRTSLFAAVLTLALAACGTETSSHVSALTGQACTPNGSYMPPPPKHQNPKCQGTGNGDNCDDLSSGKIDCIGDGNSGQGDDKKHNCMFPQPGCDDMGCCDDGMVDPPPGGGGGDTSTPDAGTGGGGDPSTPDAGSGSDGDGVIIL